MARRGEGQQPAVRRPRRLGVVEIAVGELIHGAVVCVYHEQMRTAVVDEPLAVHLVLEGRNHPRRLGRRFRRPVLLRLVAAHARHQHQARAVRRPYGITNPLRQFGQARGFAAVQRHDVQLGTLLALPLGYEGQPRSVRRPARGGVSSVTGCQTVRRPACSGHHPNVRQVLIAFLRKRRHHERHLLPVGRHPRLAHPANAGNVRRRHAPPVSCRHAVSPFLSMFNGCSGRHPNMPF